MKPARSYANVKRRWYRPAEHECPVCQRTLRQAMTLTRRTVITLEGVTKLIHAGYRCPDSHCAGSQRTYRSVEADALALSGMTYGLDVVLLVGRLHLSQHRTVDEIHRELLERLAPLGVRISRREILYLFDAYCTLLRAVSEAKDDQQWGALGVHVLGTITDAKARELQAVEQLWPKVPHQVCQFHALRDAIEPAYEADREVKTAMRKQMQRKLKAVRQQLKRQSAAAPPGEAEQLAVLDDYALGTLSALNRDGRAPFDFAAVQAAEDLDEVQASLERLSKKGEQ